MWNPFLTLSRAIARFQTNKVEEDIGFLRQELKKANNKINDLSAKIATINMNIVVLDENNKQLNAMNEIICAVQQQILDEMAYGSSKSKKVQIFPLGKSKDDDLPN